jgi:hypothetical protein
LAIYQRAVQRLSIQTVAIQSFLSVMCGLDSVFVLSAGRIKVSRGYGSSIDSMASQVPTIILIAITKRIEHGCQQ